MNVATVVILLGSIGAASFHQMLPVINLVLQNVMACKVFRLLKLGLLDDTEPTFGDMNSTLFRFGHLSAPLESVVIGKTETSSSGMTDVLEHTIQRY